MASPGTAAVADRHGFDPVAVIAVAGMHLAHQTDEHRQSADVLVAGRQPLELGADIEVGLLDAHRHFSLR